MGWDLFPVSRIEPFHVTMYAWLHVVANALEHSGADMDWFGYTNDGDYVPADVARAWADALEKGIGNLKVAIVHYSGNPPFASSDSVFVIPKSYTEEQTMKNFRREVGWFQDATLTFTCFKDLDESDADLFDKFIKFCRRSEGFYQC